MIMNRQELAKHLYGLADGTIMPRNRSEGLCTELSYLKAERGLRWKLSFEVRVIMNTWPKFSGSKMYPVPHAELGPSSAFLLLDDLWGPDQYGNDRREMCRFIADKLVEASE